MYNSPAGLYGDEALAEALHGHNLNTNGGQEGLGGHGGHNNLNTNGGQNLANQEFTPVAVTPNAANNRIYQVVLINHLIN